LLDQLITIYFLAFSAGRFGRMNRFAGFLAILNVSPIR
jgi:hypothetical protein